MMDFLNHSIERTERRVNALTYCIELAQRCDNTIPVERHRADLAAESNILEKLKSRKRVIRAFSR